MSNDLYISTVFKSNVYKAIRLPKKSVNNFEVSDRVTIIPVSDSMVVVINIDKMDGPGKKFLNGILDHVNGNDKFMILKEIIGDKHED